MYIICILYVYYMYIIYILYVHYMYVCMYMCVLSYPMELTHTNDKPRVIGREQSLGQVRRLS